MTKPVKSAKELVDRKAAIKTIKNLLSKDT